MVKKIKACIRRKIRNAAISVSCWTRKGKQTLCNTNGDILDIALKMIICVVLAILVLDGLKNLWGVDILPQVTDKIDGMWS
jgi:hypothetical protein